MKVEFKKKPTKQQTPEKPQGTVSISFEGFITSSPKRKKEDEVMELYLHTSLREFPYRNLDSIKTDININLVFLTF